MYGPQIYGLTRALIEKYRKMKNVLNSTNPDNKIPRIIHMHSHAVQGSQEKPVISGTTTVRVPYVHKYIDQQKKK